jgi:hypothetical protein
MDRAPAAWETGAAGAFLTLGEVEVWALGEQRFRVVSPNGSEEVEGFEQARERSRELAGC